MARHDELSDEERHQLAVEEEHRRLVEEERRIALATSIIDAEHFIFEDIPSYIVTDKGVEVPTFAIGEVSKCFFGRSPHWIRWCEKSGLLVLHGKDVSGDRRTKKVVQKGKRVDVELPRSYHLADIELIAHALMQNGTISLDQFVLAIAAVRNVALQWRIL